MGPTIRARGFHRKGLTWHITAVLPRKVFSAPQAVIRKEKIDKSDEGELAFMMGTEKDNVVIIFNTPVHWIGMTPTQAVDLAEHLIKKARSISKEPLTVNL